METGISLILAVVGVLYEGNMIIYLVVLNLAYSHCSLGRPYWAAKEIKTCVLETKSCLAKSNTHEAVDACLGVTKK